MGTRAFIAKKKGKKSYEYLTIDRAGGPDYTGKMLNNDYVDVATINKMFKLGDIKILGHSIEEAEQKQKHKAPSYTIFHVRDLGVELDEDEELDHTVDDIDDLFTRAYNDGCDYIYIWNENKSKWIAYEENDIDADDENQDNFDYYKEVNETQNQKWFHDFAIFEKIKNLNR